MYLVDDLESEAPRRTARTWLWAILITDVLIKAIFLATDSRPRLFLGDSVSYLYTATSGWIPADRSFAYGFVLRAIAVWPHSLRAMVCVHAALSAVTCWLVAFCLIRYSKLKPAVAAMFSLVCTIEPLQVLAERFVMTETLATFLFAVFVTLCFEYLASNRLRWLALVQVVSVLLISIRISFLPVAILCSVCLPFFTGTAQNALAALRKRPVSLLPIRALIIAVILGAVLSQTLLFGYRHFYASLIEAPMHGHPAYLYRDGFFLLSDVAPLLKPIDYPFPAQRDAVFKSSPVELTDLRAREAQRWLRDGICDRISRQFGGDEAAADPVARKTALRAMKRDPLGVVNLATRTLLDYFDRPYFASTLELDEGLGAHLQPAQISSLRTQFGEDFNSPRVITFIERWHEKLFVWYWFVLIFPMLYVPYTALVWRRVSRYQCLCALLMSPLFVEVIVTVTRPTARYLTATAWLLFVAIGAALPTWLQSGRDFRSAFRDPDTSHITP